MAQPLDAIQADLLDELPMTQSLLLRSQLPWLSLFALAALVGGCGKKDSILGPAGNPMAPPAVVDTTPARDLSGVAVTDAKVSVRFNQAIAFDSGARFVITCSSPCINPTGNVQVDANNQQVSFTPAANLAGKTLYTASIAGVRGISSQVPMSSDYIWRFTTADTPTALGVTLLAPTMGSSAVALNNSQVSATFSEPVGPIGTDPNADGASFILTCAAPCTSPNGSVSLDASGKVASYRLPVGTTLAPLTLYTATIKGAKALSSGNSLAAPFSWQFTTGTTADASSPRVTRTQPLTTVPGPSLNVPSNMAISAAFSEAMAPGSISDASFTLSCEAPCVNPVGTTSYAPITQSALFTPTTPLAANTTYKATITSAAEDLAGNGLASDYVWQFTTSTPALAAQLSVASTSPATNSVTACPNAAINARFNIPSGFSLNPASLTSENFSLTTAAPALAPIAIAGISLDAPTGSLATLTPAVALQDGVRYTARLKGGGAGVQDAAIPANALAEDYEWSFTAQACSNMPPMAVSLGSAAGFAVFGGSAGVTNQGINTQLNGDLGTTAASTLVTGFHHGLCSYTETTLNLGAVNGAIYSFAPAPSPACSSEGNAQTQAIAQSVRADSLAAYNALVALAPGPDPGAGNLANLVLAPGVYTAAAGSFMIQGGDLTLDAQGDANGVWVFQMASSLTLGGPGATAPQSIILVNGAQAKNVFWQVGTAATVNAAGGGSVAGTLISQAGAVFSTAGNETLTTLNGRALSLNGAVTLVNTVINVPAQ